MEINHHEKETIKEKENGKGNTTNMRGTFKTEWVRNINEKGKMCRQLKGLYKLNKENITRKQ